MDKNLKRIVGARECQWIVAGSIAVEAVVGAPNFKRSKVAVKYKLTGAQLLGTICGMKVYRSDAMEPDDILCGFSQPGKKAARTRS